MKPPILDLFFWRRTPVILQAEAAECGLACLAMVAGYHDLNYDLSALRGRLAVSLRGVTLAQLMQMSSQLRFSARALRLEIGALAQLRTPCILHWNLDHFVVLERVSAKQIFIVDPAVGRRAIALADASKHFSGIALELTPADNFETRNERSGLTLAPFVKGVKGLPKALIELFLLSVAMQALTILTPFYSQLIIDDVLANGDVNLLTVLAVAFGLLTLLNVTIGTIRSFVVLRLGAHLQFGWAVRLFHHLIRLPLTYFERRSTADVLSRFRSLGSIQSLASTTIVEAVIDGLMTITTLAVMFVYSPKLTLLPLGALLVYILIRLSVYGRQRENATEALMSAAKEDSHFLESLRGILAIKSFSREQVREATWQNRAADAIRAKNKSNAFATAEQAANQLLFGVENILVLAMGANLAISGGFSVGMLFAFITYKVQFTARASALADKVMDFRLSNVHLNRISDIALAEEEIGFDEGAPERPPIEGAIELVGVGYRYAETESWILEGACLKVSIGECIGINAPSGSGKTTLIKIMMGLLTPQEGRILVDGMELTPSSAIGYRQQIAGVMQEDTLLSGSIADNISFFDPRPDQKLIETCARAAAIHDDIVRMPMAYYTLVGDMGAALSGGQKQRVLIARALYAQPRILFLDEATSHLDPATELKIHRTLAELRVTRIIVAHRAETLALATRILTLTELSSLKDRGAPAELTVNDK